MKTPILFITFACSLGCSAMAQDITGAGSTFAFPILAKWSEQYHVETQNGMNYQSIGSGGGIKQIEAKTVDFGASDKPLEQSELDKNHLVQWPIIIGGVVPVVHVSGIKAGDLTLTGTVLSNIYLGKITKWNDPAIAALNPKVPLPNLDILVVSRSEGSGTTFVFTHYLSQVSPDWKTQVGSNASVKWPTGINGKGNEGVASYVRQQEGSIGYLEYAYVIQNHMSYANMVNQAGAKVSPDSKSFAAAAANAHWQSSNGFNEVLTNEPGAGSWPITGATFILMQKKQDHPENGVVALKFFDWAYRHGQNSAIALDYIPMPDSVVSQIEQAWHEQLSDNQGHPIWK